MEGDGDDDLHRSAGDLRQVPGVQDEEVGRPLALSGVHHDAQQHTWGGIQEHSYVINLSNHIWGEYKNIIMG